MSSLRVLHLPTPVAGNAWSLSRGERALGMSSDVLTAYEDMSRRPTDMCLNLTNDMSKFRKAKILTEAFLKVRSNYDIFHFNYGSSLLHFPGKSLYNLELPFYPKAAKIFVTYNGCDARQKFPTMKRSPIAACHEVNCYGGQCNTGRLDEERRRGIEKMSRYAKHMWAVNPDLLYFLPKEKSSFLPYSVDFSGLEYRPPGLDKKLTIVHAPTDRAAKGTHIILSTLERLKVSYPNQFEVILVEGLPQKEALKIYEKADLVIDQVLIGWYGAFAVEAMAMGKPVIARISKEDLKFLPEAMARDLSQAVINADSKNLFSVLADCLENRGKLRNWSEAGREYASKWHDIRFVAGLTKEKYEI